jgi:hypothetical protein
MQNVILGNEYNLIWEFLLHGTTYGTTNLTREQVCINESHVLSEY